VPKTPEQRAADVAIEEAVMQVVQAYDLLDDATMVDFVGVVEGVKFDDDGELDAEHFGLVFRNGAARSTVALGLLEKGRDLLLNGERVDP
jgi:hypothetical protein